MTNWLTFKITFKDEVSASGRTSNGQLIESGIIYLILDNSVRYEDKNSEIINCDYVDPFKDFRVGDYLEIDLDKTVMKSSWHTFNDVSIIRKVSSSINVISSRGSSSNIVISPSVVNAMNSSGTMDLARRMSKMVDETGKNFEFSIEDATNGLKYSLICRKD